MHDLDRAAEALRGTFPGCEDAPLAMMLLRLLAEGRPVTTAALAGAAGRAQDEVVRQLARWPNVERDGDPAVVGFSGLTLRETAHSFEAGGRRLHTWCAWDTLFLPALLDTSARVRSTCPVTRTGVELVVSPDCVEQAEPEQLYLSFPPVTATDIADITRSFCCHVHFLAGTDAGRAWRRAHPDGEVLDLTAAFSLGCTAVAPFAAASAGKQCC
jgi:alkylmercury lyase